MPLQEKPLEFSDFSGGITENVLQGDPRRYAIANNYFITVDKKLEVRPGYLPYSEGGYYLFGATGQRINGLHTIFNDTILLPQSARQIYAYNGAAWDPILGVDGKETLTGGDANSQTTLAEFQRQVYIANDGTEGDTGTRPSKIYRNTENLWVARTVGLPRAYVDGNYTDGSLLAKCIVNANAIRASMVSHFLDAKNTIYVTPGFTQAPFMQNITPTNLHMNVDRVCLSMFQSTPINGDPQASSFSSTPLGPCTDQNTMLTLVGALQTAYRLHSVDMMRGSYGNSVLQPPRYHQDLPINQWNPVIPQVDYITKGPYAILENEATPDTVEEAAAMLDDLLQKWNWHRKAVNVHSPTNDPAQFNKYEPLASKIGTIQIGLDSAPTITPNYGDIFAYVNNLRNLYNKHVTNSPIGQGGHKMRDNMAFQASLECRLDEATTLDDAFLMIYWLRALYFLHHYDANLYGIAGYTRVSFASTAGSPNLTSVTATTTGAPMFMNPGGSLQSSVSMFLPTLNQYDGNGSYTTARIISAGSGTAVLDRPAQVTGTTIGQYARSVYHSSYDANGLNLVDAITASPEQAADALTTAPQTTGTSTEGWLSLAYEFFNSFAQHAKYKKLHTFTAGLWYDAAILVVPYPNFQIPDVAYYGYAFYFSHRYTVEANGIEYLTLGNPVLAGPVEAAVSYPVGYVTPNQNYYASQSFPVSFQRGNLITNLPVLTNSANTNYDLSQVELNIYRTSDGGNTLFKLASVPNGTTSYLDVVNDNVPNPGDIALVDRQTIYTTGGVVGFDQPPICKYIHILNGTTYYGAVTEDGQYFPNRIRQSVQFAPDASPATFYIDLDDEVVGISSARGNLIAFCKSSIFRVSGGFSSTGQGSLQSDNISDTLGGVNAKSIVQTEIGVFFAATDGFYYTDGYQIIKVSLELENTYQTFIQSDAQRRSIYGAYDKSTRRIHWAVKTAPTDSDNSVVYVFYLDYGVKPSGTFTTQSDGLNFRPSSLAFQKGICIYGHEKGYLLKSDPWNKWDVIIDPETIASEWLTKAIPYHFRSVAVDMGSTYNRKWTTKIHIVGNNSGNAAMIPYVIRDVNQTGQGSVPMAPINYKGNITWGKTTQIWGTPTDLWKTDGKMDLWRRFPARTLRSDFLQVEFKPALICVYASTDDYWDEDCVLTYDSSLKRAYLSSISHGFAAWPKDVVNYELRTAFDNYEASYPITRRNGIGSFIEISDPGDTLPTIFAPGVEWEIWGVKKEQRPTLTTFVLHFAYLGDENQSYPGKSTSSGPGNAGENP